MGVIVSTFIYETVIRHGPDLTGYSHVQAACGGAVSCRRSA